MPVTDSPLRYPGGKTQLAPFVIELLRANDLFYGIYVEPFAGGCGIAWKLLLNDYVSEVRINDIDKAIYAFWASVLRHADDLCELIETTPVTMEEWHRQREVQGDSRATQLALGFSTLFLNRTNRSGILKGGVIGGLEQSGDYALDCRFNKPDLIRKIQRIAARRSQVVLTRLDAEDFISGPVRGLPGNTLVNVDPPYYRKGPGLYCSFYEHADHVALARCVTRMRQPWMVTYDDVPEIRALYQRFPMFNKELNYFAQVKRVGVELMVFDRRLRLPAEMAAA
jgi:DNA adenine methylase